ncbi:Ig-like domain-containing protein [Mycolicibacterium phlei]|uniref:Ig-like domain-containing protein n=1 Tax=Mycolicibacterium phlei TaxID=1771 RepID=UPI000ACE11F7|nr:Ig-like domain-containing protein [Mycolicibacterium phlei]
MQTSGQTYARHIGRIGALAVALGVGAAVATGLGAGTAWADDDSDSSSSNSSSSSSDPDTSSTGGDTGATVSSPAHDDGGSDGDASQDAGPRAPSVPEMKVRSSGGAHTANTFDSSDSSDAGAETGTNSIVSTRTVVQRRDSSHEDDTDSVAVVRAVSTQSVPDAQPEPAEPAPSAALWGVLGWTARREAQGELRDAAAQIAVATAAADEGAGGEEPKNQPPVVMDATYTIDFYDVLEIRAVESAHDPDGDPMWVSAVGKTFYGSITVSEGSIFYMPTLRETDTMVTEKFSYTITDAAGNSSTATVIVNIRPPKADPVAVDDNVSTSVNTPVTIDVLRNDSGVLKLVSVGNPQYGTVVLTREGLVSYTPKENFTGVDTFQYTVVDGKGVSHTATVTVEVRGKEDTGPTYTVERNDKLTVPVETGVRDPKYDGWKVNLDKKPENGTLELNDDGSFTYVPNEGFVGQDTFAYYVTNGKEKVGPFVAVINVTDRELAEPEDPTQPIEFETPVAAPGLGVPFATSSAIGVCWDDWMPWQQGPGALNLTCLYPEARREV